MILNDAKINYYLSKKWGLEDRVDSDGDGIGDEFEELAGSLPMDAESTPVVDLSDTVADQIGISSQLNSKEDDLKLWLDASDIDMGANASITDGDSLSQWIDLSGNGYHATQEDDGQKPQIQLNELNGLGMIQFDGSDDYFTVPKEMNGEYSFKLFMLVSFDINSIAGDNTFMMKGSSSYVNWPMLYYRTSGDIFYYMSSGDHMAKQQQMRPCIGWSSFSGI